MPARIEPKGSFKGGKYVMRIVKMILLLLIVIILIYVAMMNFQNRSRIVFSEHLDDVAVTVDGEDITLEDLSFYVLYEEQLVEEQARIYNPESPKDYWNAHTNGYFLQGKAKEAVIGMAIHDRIFYRLARENNLVMSSKDKEMLENARTDFWSSLFDEQLEKLPTDYDTINHTIAQMALAQIYQQKLADELGVTYSGLNWNGYDYQKMLEVDHKVKYNNAVWKRIIIGDITLTHTRVNYINGWDSEDEKRKNEENQKH